MTHSRDPRKERNPYYSSSRITRSLSSSVAMTNTHKQVRVSCRLRVVRRVCCVGYGEMSFDSRGLVCEWKPRSPNQNKCIYDLWYYDWQTGIELDRKGIGSGCSGLTGPRGDGDVLHAVKLYITRDNTYLYSMCESIYFGCDRKESGLI